MTFDSDHALKIAVAELIAVEPRFGDIAMRHGAPPLRRMPGGLEGLLRIVTDQMISLHAGAAVWARLKDEFETFAPDRIAATPVSRLMELGLSGAKAHTFRAAADAAIAGTLDFSRLAGLDDAEAHRYLTRLPGIGPWTADIYLLAALGRPDTWPSGDLALQVAAQSLFNLPKRPAGKEMVALALPWRPWRAAAARLLWSHYRGLKRLPQDPA
jgi:DNA-3-methyladenine glycosylase II